MIFYVMAVLVAAINGTGSLTQKLWQKKTMMIPHAESVYILLMSSFATVAFFVMNRFSFVVNRYTLICSMGFAICAILANLLILLAMSQMSLLLCSVFQRGSTLLIWLWGVLVMHDSVQAVQVLAAVLMTASILVPLYGNQRHVITKKAVLNGVAMIVNSAASSIILKYYTQNQQKMSDSCLCLYTNLLMLGYILIRAVLSKNRKEQMIALSKTKRFQFYILLGTVGSNLATVLSMYVMRHIPISVYSIISSAAGFVIVFINSKVIFREECSGQELISFLFSAAAVLLMLIKF